ncbi:MAG TPA: hypothetical protein PKC39_14370 [Ferruginibacter sp.]|nr:hypothetical protein [Ferruginibacter sp.]HMP22140.1 hypothetical protein [Ferruginibacter sp.]
MKQIFKKVLVITLLTGIVGAVFADRGTGKKAKTNLNIATGINLKSSIGFNLKSGLSYKGSLLSTNNTPTIGSGIVNNSLVTYQKGNITYILPYTYKIAVPEITPGYTGVKIIIRPH